jgi:hypothetical protein
MCAMRDLLWVCDELYLLHKDLEAIRERERQAAAQQKPTQPALTQEPDKVTAHEQR